MHAKGYTALFREPLADGHIKGCVERWLSDFDKVEQVSSGGGGGALTYAIKGIEEVHFEKSMQFRVVAGNDFTWVYITRGGYVIETTGMPGESEVSLCLDVLLELPNVVEVIDHHNDRRLDELEAEGLM